MIFIVFPYNFAPSCSVANSLLARMKASTTVMMCTSLTVFFVLPSVDRTNMEFVAFQLPHSGASVDDCSMDLSASAAGESASSLSSSSSSASAADAASSASVQSAARIVATGVLSTGSCLFESL